jgi:hypothetical protein
MPLSRGRPHHHVATGRAFGIGRLAEETVMRRDRAPRGALLVGPVGLAAQAHYRGEHPPRGRESRYRRS